MPSRPGYRWQGAIRATRHCSGSQQSVLPNAQRPGLEDRLQSACHVCLKGSHASSPSDQNLYTTEKSPELACRFLLGVSHCTSCHAWYSDTSSDALGPFSRSSSGIE